MANSSKARGDRFERAVLAAFQRCGFPWAARTRAGYERDHGDIHLAVGRAVIVQAKNRARMAWTEWLAQLAEQKANAGADHAVLVVKRPGMAAGEDALAVMRVQDMARLLRAAGYGDALDDQEKAS